MAPKHPSASPPVHSPAVHVAAVVEQPAPAPVEAGPPALDPKILVKLAGAIDELKVAKSVEASARGAMALAVDSHSAAKAKLEYLRKMVIESAAELAGGDLADNFLALTDDEAKKLAGEAQAARKGVPEHARAKLFGA